MAQRKTYKITHKVNGVEKPVIGGKVVGQKDAQTFLSGIRDRLIAEKSYSAVQVKVNSVSLTSPRGHAHLLSISPA